MDITKLNTKRLLAYYRAHRDRCLFHYNHSVIDDDENNDVILGWSVGCGDIEWFDKDIQLLTDLKTELDKREHLILKK
jgi:hypothetical protein